MKKKSFAILAILLALAVFTMGARVVINGVPYESFSNVLVSDEIIVKGTSLSKINVVLKTAATYTIGTDDVDESKGSIFVNNDNDAIAWTLDTAAVGKSGCAAQGVGVSAAITVTPGTGDRFVKDGTALTIATAYTSNATGLAKLCWVAIDNTYWMITTEVGVWSE